ncbi:MAG: DUF1998 domain-containing protein [Chloroflexota bacterium]
MTATSTTKSHRIGELRPSQLLFSFGVGSIIDLPRLSVMVMGLDDWNVANTREIVEERLLQAVKAQLGQQVEKLRFPPAIEEQNGAPLAGFYDETSKVGVPVAVFPRWMLCPEYSCRLLAPLESGLFQLKTDLFHPDKTRYVHVNCPKSGLSRPAVLPARFLVACSAGHLDDFPWERFVHSGPTKCNYRLRLLELGVSGEAADILVKCDTCGESKRMSEAFGEAAAKSLPPCSGRSPHLRSYVEESCKEKNRAILLGASNSWFPVYLSALSIPKAPDKLGLLVESYWTLLKNASSPDIMKAFRNSDLLPRLATYSEEDIWSAIQRKNSLDSGQAPDSGETKATNLKLPEWQVLSDPSSMAANLTANGGYSDFQITPIAPPVAFQKQLEEVVLVERLREVQALIGFTRIESPRDFGEADAFPSEHRVKLARKAPSWVPAAEVRGEGLFLRFNEAAILDWLAQPYLQNYDYAFRKAHRKWRKFRGIPNLEAGYPGTRYILLHSLSHALMRQLTLECGYTAASIRERIYSSYPEEEGGPMAGILIYTAAPDSEGTLGGLVALGQPEQLGHHLEAALDQIRLCASDPLCAEHFSTRGQTLHGASCHACLFAPETSCERGNKYLDRSVLVPTVDKDYLAFFQ